MSFLDDGATSYRVRLRSFPRPSCAVRASLRGVRRLGRGVFFRASLRLGLFGGTFDPAHRGHAMLAERAQRRLLLGRVLWVVARCPRLKDGGGRNKIGSFRDRMASADTALAMGEASGGSSLVSGLEERWGMTSTREVVCVLRRALYEYDLVFLVGSDGFARFGRWRSWRVLARMVSFGVFARRGSDLRARLGMAGRALPCARRGVGLLRLAGRGSRGSAARWGFVGSSWIGESSSALRSGSGR